jgi:hypothetical protein
LQNNIFKNFEQINPDSESLANSIYKSGENLEDIEEKIYSYELDESNYYGKILMNIFKKNIFYGKQV